MNSQIFLSFSTLSTLPNSIYYILCGILSLAVLSGVHLMSKVETAQMGNKISALAIALGIIITLIKKDILPIWLIYPGIVIGLAIGLLLAKKVRMIEMPQLVALLNGIGGAASAIVASFVFIEIYYGIDFFGKFTASLAVVIGSITLFGSLVAAGKLHKVIAQKPVILPCHQVFSLGLLIILIILIVLGGFFSLVSSPVLLTSIIIIASAFGIIFSIRVGGADMPITISLLNSLSGVAAAVAGFALKDVLLVSIGGIVGASGLFLTQVMCKAMNRKLMDIMLGKTSSNNNKTEIKVSDDTFQEEEKEEEIHETADPIEIIKNAKKVIIVPGYGMALAQAQHLVNNLAKKLVANGASIKYAIHPVAGRMPGHMDVLLIEAGVAFEDVYEMDDVNDEFKDTDVTIVVGANDVLNPAARSAEGTPIYGMPILNVDQSKNIVIFNYDLQPGYSGVENPIYTRKSGVWVMQGDAAVTITELLNKM